MDHGSDLSWYVSPSHSIPPSSRIWLIHSNFLRDSFLTKKRSISPARSKVRSRGIIDDLPGQTLSYLSPPDLSSALIHHKLKLYSGGVALAPLSAQPFVQRSSPRLHLELLEGAALKPAVQHLCCSGQMVITESICQTQAPSLVAKRHLPFPSLLFSSPSSSAFPVSITLPVIRLCLKLKCLFHTSVKHLSSPVVLLRFMFMLVGHAEIMHDGLTSVTVSNKRPLLREHIHTQPHTHTHKEKKNSETESTKCTG